MRLWHNDVSGLWGYKVMKLRLWHNYVSGLWGYEVEVMVLWDYRVMIMIAGKGVIMLRFIGIWGYKIMG
jgi:hypothetical protein